MSTYQYALKGGGLGTLEAANPDEAQSALTKVAGVDPNSGVQAISPTDTPASTPVSTLSSGKGKSIITGKVGPAVADATTMQDAASKARQDQAKTDSSATDISSILTPEEQANTQLKNDKDVQAYKASVRSLTLANNADAEAQIAGLHQSYDQLRAETEKSNQYREAAYSTSGIRSGMARYSPQGQADLVTAVKDQGLKKLSDIDAKYNAAVSEVKTALATKNYTLAANSAQTIMTLKQKFLDTIQKNKDEADKLLRQTKLSDGIMEIVGGGETDPTKILKALKAKGIQVDSIKDVVSTIKDLTKSDSALDDILSVTESQALGVPFGTTKREAFGMTAHSKGTIGDLTPAQQNASFKLADDYEQRSKDFFTVQSQYERVKASAKNPSGAGDISLIFAYMKMLDPNSTVREGEFATAQNSGSVPQNMIAQYNKVISGQRLSESQRKDFMTRAGGIYNAQKSIQQQTQNLYTQRAEQLGIPSEFVVRPINDIGANDQADPAARLQQLYQSDPSAKAKVQQIIRDEGITDPAELLQLYGDSDPISMKASNLAQSIAMAETGNKQVKGASGENGAFQFMPATWAKISMETTGRLLPQTPENERQVATAKIEKLLQNHTEEEVALIWNTSLGGTEQPRRISGTNDKGVAYDSNAYAKKVMKIYKSMS